MDRGEEVLWMQPSPTCFDLTTDGRETLNLMTSPIDFWWNKADITSVTHVRRCLWRGLSASTFAFLKVKRETVIVRKRRMRKRASWLRIRKQPEHEKCPIDRYFIHPVTQRSWGLSPMRSDGKGYHSNGVVSWPRMSADTYTSAPPLSWNLPPSLHAYLFQATGVPIRIIFPDFDWHTRGATDHN